MPKITFNIDDVKYKFSYEEDADYDIGPAVSIKCILEPLFKISTLSKYTFIPLQNNPSMILNELNVLGNRQMQDVWKDTLNKYITTCRESNGYLIVTDNETKEIIQIYDDGKSVIKNNLALDKSIKNIDSTPNLLQQYFLEYRDDLGRVLGDGELSALQHLKMLNSQLDKSNLKVPNSQLDKSNQAISALLTLIDNPIYEQAYIDFIKVLRTEIEVKSHFDMICDAKILNRILPSSLKSLEDITEKAKFIEELQKLQSTLPKLCKAFTVVAFNPKITLDMICENLGSDLDKICEAINESVLSKDFFRQEPYCRNIKLQGILKDEYRTDAYRVYNAAGVEDKNLYLYLLTANIKMILEQKDNTKDLFDKIISKSTGVSLNIPQASKRNIKDALQEAFNEHNVKLLRLVQPPGPVQPGPQVVIINPVPVPVPVQQQLPQVRSMFDRFKAILSYIINCIKRLLRINTIPSNNEPQL